MLPGFPAPRRPPPTTELQPYQPPKLPPIWPAEPRTPYAPYDYTYPPPAPTPKPAGPVIRAERELGGLAKAIVAALGILVSLLTAFGALPFVPPDARELVAIFIGACTPVILYFVPNWQAPGTKGTDDAP